MLIKRIRILQKINETEDLVQRGGTIYPWGRGVTVDYPRSMVSHSFIPSRSNHYVTRIFRIERETWGSVLTFTCFIVMRWEFVCWERERVFSVDGIHTRAKVWVSRQKAHSRYVPIITILSFPYYKSTFPYWSQQVMLLLCLGLATMSRVEGPLKWVF